MQICDDIIEWNYGDYEGITTATIRETVPDWTVWSHGCPNGEDAPQVEARCTTAISTALAIPGDGDVALFAHGHILRALAGTWLGLGAAGGHSALECPIHRELLDQAWISLLQTRIISPDSFNLMTACSS